MPPNMVGWFRIMGLLLKRTRQCATNNGGIFLDGHKRVELLFTLTRYFRGASARRWKQMNVMCASTRTYWMAYPRRRVVSDQRDGRRWEDKTMRALAVA